MAIEPILNEPGKATRNDIVPRFDALVPATLDALTRARLELEWKLRVCRTDPSDELQPIEFTPQQREVLLRMLGETDSPLSASLRASAAAIAGPLRLVEAVPLLRAMALDANEDRRTQLHAIASFISLSAADAAEDLKTLLRSGDAFARAAALTAAIQTGEPVLESIAHVHLQHEQNESVRSIVARRIPSLTRELSTKKPALVPKYPPEGRPRKSPRVP
jgi:HEAT repeat protein